MRNVDERNEPGDHRGQATVGPLLRAVPRWVLDQGAGPGGADASLGPLLLEWGDFPQLAHPEEVLSYRIYMKTPRSVAGLWPEEFEHPFQEENGHTPFKLKSPVSACGRCLVAHL